MTAILLADQSEGVLTLTLHRPPANALSSDLIAALHKAVVNAATDPAARVIVIKAEGKVFCAGHDLKDIRAHRADQDGGRAYLETLFEDCAAMMQAITTGPRPVIAMVDGLATAAGAQLVAACDLAFVSERATFCTPGVNMGGFCSTPMVAIARNLSRKHAMEMALSGDVFDAETALRWGLVNRVVPPEALADTVSAFARRLASRAPGPVGEGKQTLLRQLDLPLDAAYAEASALMVRHFLGADSDAGLDAFFARPAPQTDQT